MFFLSSSFCCPQHKKRIHQENEWHDKAAWLHQISHNVNIVHLPISKKKISIDSFIHSKILISIQHQDRKKKKTCREKKRNYSETREQTFKWIQFTTHCLMSETTKTASHKWLNGLFRPFDSTLEWNKKRK